MVPKPLPGEVTLKQAVKLSGNSESTIRRAIRNGELASRQRTPSGAHFITEVNLAAWLGVESFEESEAAS